MTTQKIIGALLFLLLGCSQPATNSNSKRVEVKHYELDGDLTDTYQTDLFVSETNDSIIYKYVVNDTAEQFLRIHGSILYTIGIGKSNDDKLVHFKQQIPLVGRNTFQVDGRNVEIRKYDYDLPYVIDEEEYVYFMDNYGVIAFKGHGWIYMIHFDDGGQLGKDVFRLLQSDTTGFFGMPHKM